MKRHPLIKHVAWLGENRVRLIFSTGSVRDAELPVRSAKRAHIMGCGLGLDFGNGVEASAIYMYEHSKVVRSERIAWLQAHPDYRRVVVVAGA
jgi:hypothetical protein